MTGADHDGDAAGAGAQAFALRLFLASQAAAELMVVYLGIELGLYDAMGGDAVTPGELAARAGIAPRYAREWLEQQAAAAVVEADDARAPSEERRYRLPPGHLEALTDSHSPSYVGALAVLPAGGVAPVLPRLAEAMRSGEGVPYDAYGETLRAAHAGMNRAVFEHELAGWVAGALPEVHRRLERDGGAIADVGCGSGWSSVALARAYPAAEVHGYDLDRAAIAAARANVPADARERLRFDASGIEADGGRPRYDLICILDALHDMSRPVEVLAACRAALAEDGCVLLMEPKVGMRFAAPAGDVERFLYAVSVLHCLPVGLTGPDAAGTGTVMRPSTVRRYATAAGFRRATVLPVEHRFHRLYRLDH